MRIEKILKSPRYKDRKTAQAPARNGRPVDEEEPFAVHLDRALRLQDAIKDLDRLRNNARPG